MNARCGTRLSEYLVLKYLNSCTQRCLVKILSYDRCVIVIIICATHSHVECNVTYGDVFFKHISKRNVINCIQIALRDLQLYVNA